MAISHDEQIWCHYFVDVFGALIENQFSMCMRKFNSDNGEKFLMQIYTHFSRINELSTKTVVLILCNKIVEWNINMI